MEEVEPVGDVYLLVLSFNPGKLVHDLVAPLVHALIANVHLRIEDPQEAEPLLGQQLHRDVHYLRVGHRVVVEVELIVGEHEACVVALGSLDPPGRVDLDHLELA